MEKTRSEWEDSKHDPVKSVIQLANGTDIEKLAELDRDRLTIKARCAECGLGPLPGRCPYDRPFTDCPRVVNYRPGTALNRHVRRMLAKRHGKGKK